ncbi:hypothetical protein COO60DRAFT_403137 [Scenedesmus sp. NREL 46B-D3]|nr:hypothetical protein COO60DRAFT_403137 [Scenedesmus sp. NREL 46B-D3]
MEQPHERVQDLARMHMHQRWLTPCVCPSAALFFRQRLASAEGATSLDAVSHMLCRLQVHTRALATQAPQPRHPQTCCRQHRQLTCHTGRRRLRHAATHRRQPRRRAPSRRCRCCCCRRRRTCWHPHSHRAAAARCRPLHVRCLQPQSGRRQVHGLAQHGRHHLLQLTRRAAVGSGSGVRMRSRMAAAACASRSAGTCSC